MKDQIRLEALLSWSANQAENRLRLFALVNLGVIDSLAEGLWNATDAIRLFYNAENCLFVKNKLKDKLANRIMSHGVQLDTLFTILSESESHREFYRELTTMRSLCGQIIENERAAVTPSRTPIC
jgi:hypothetical protein